MTPRRRHPSTRRPDSSGADPYPRAYNKRNNPPDGYTPFDVQDELRRIEADLGILSSTIDDLKRDMMLNPQNRSIKEKFERKRMQRKHRRGEYQFLMTWVVRYEFADLIERSEMTLIHREGKRFFAQKYSSQHDPPDRESAIERKEMLDEMNVAVSDLIDSLSHAWSELNPLGFNTHLYHPADRYRQLKSDLVR